MFDEWIHLTAAGLDPIPCHTDKNPGVVKDWQTHEWTDSEVEAWYAKHPDHGIGIRLSGTVIDLEYDTNDPNTEQEVAEFLGCSPITVSWRSSRGVHRLFTIDEEQRQTFLAANVANRVKVGSLELHLGLTGKVFVVTPPVNPRQWITEPHQAIICNLPDRCIELIAATGKPTEQFEQYDGPMRPGDELAMKLSWEKILIPHGWTKAGGNLWRRPGKTEGHSATLGWYKDELTGEDKLHVFSSNAPPFKENTSYDKFYAFSLLNHDGDMKAAAGAAIEILNQEFDGSEFGPGVPSIPFVEEGTDAPVEQAAAKPELNPICFDNLFGEYANELNDLCQAETDPVAVMAQAFEIFGCMLDRDVYFVTEEGPVYLNDYLMVVGTSGEGRKGTAWKHAKRLFEQEQRYNDIIHGRVDSGEGLLKELDARSAQEFGGDTASMLIQDSEAAGLLSKMKIENSTLSQNLIQGWDCSAMSMAKSKDRLVVKKPYVSLVGHIQPEVLKNQLSFQMLHSGLMNRIQFIYVERVRRNMFAQPMDAENLIRYQERIAEILKSKPRGQLKFDNGAHQILNDFYHSDGISERDHIHVMKNASRLSVLDGRLSISRRNVESAIAYQTYVQECRGYLLGDWGPDAEIKDDAEKAIMYVTDMKNVTRTELSQKCFRGHKSSRDLDAIIDYASKNLNLASKSVKIAGAKKPTTVFFVRTIIKSATPKPNDDNDLQ
jgi:Protein of unknown function (DUF3987)/Bifunctional DNA primase/polymerase, N-terminal